jgi:hypothetical protein
LRYGKRNYGSFVSHVMDEEDARLVDAAKGGSYTPLASSSTFTGELVAAVLFTTKTADGWVVWFRVY